MGLLLGSGNTTPQYPYNLWYGVQGDLTSQDYKLTRVGNLDLHRSLPIQKKLRRFVENTDGSVKYYLHSNDSRKRDGGAAAVIDGSAGNVMLEKPEYYKRVEFDGTKWIYAISEYDLPGFVLCSRKTISPWYASYNAAGTQVISGCWLTWNGDNIARDAETDLPIFSSGAPRGGNGTNWDDTYRSLIGMAKTNVAKAAVRALCVNGTHIGAGRCYNDIAWLQRIEYASLHCQDTYTETLTADGFHQGGLGSGCTVVGGEWNTHNSYNPFVPCGVTATLGNNTGKVTYKVKNWANSGNDKEIQVTSYRGLEAPFEYLTMLADDLLVWHKTDKSEIYVCEDPTKFTSPSDSAASAPNGYEPVAEVPRSSGYGLTLSINSKGWAFIDKIGGAENKGVCDYYYSPINGASFSAWGWYGALLSYTANGGAGAGFGSLDAPYRSSSAHASVGFRLCRN